MDSKQYYITLPDKTQEGPYDEKALIARYQASKYPEGTLVWCEGMAGWILIETMISSVEKITNEERETTDCNPNSPQLSVSNPPTPQILSIPYYF